MKKIYSLVIALLFFTNALNAQNFTVGNFSYTVNEGDNNTCTLGKYEENGSGMSDVMIPSTVTYEGKTYTVNTIGYTAFSDAKNVLSVIMPNTITKIDDYAFFLCSNLQSVTFSSNLESIGNDAFYNCEGLKSVTIPNSVKSIGEWAFAVCVSLSNVVLPESIKSLGYNTFYACYALENITLPSTLEVLGDYCFYYCTGLKNIALPSYLKQIGKYCFGSCEALQNIEFPSSLEKIDEGAFTYCTSLKNIVINVPEIARETFRACTSLTQISLGNKIKTIGDYAFFTCHSLTSVTIPSSVEVIGCGIFSNCSSLEAINVESGNTRFQSQDGVLYNKGMTVLLNYPGGKKDTYFKFPSTVTTIIEEAFNGTVNLTGIEISAALRDLEGVTFFGSSLKNFDVASGNPLYSSVDGVLFDKKKESLIWYPAGRTDETYTIPSFTKTLKSYAFSTSKLVKMSIPSTVETIELGLFHSAYLLKELNFPADMKGTIPTGVAYYCEGLEKVNIPDGITVIGPNAFQGCMSLKSIKLPDNLERIEYLGFAYDYSLKEIWLPEKVKFLGSQAFGYCNNAETLYFPASIEECEYQPFIGCNNLQTVYYPAAEPRNFRSESNPANDAYWMFSSNVYYQATLKVPESAYDSIWECEPWNYFQNIEIHDFAGIEEVEVTVETDIDYQKPMDIYNLNGQLISHSIENVVPGIYILRQGNITKKVYKK